MLDRNTVFLASRCELSSVQADNEHAYCLHSNLYLHCFNTVKTLRHVRWEQSDADVQHDGQMLRGHFPSHYHVYIEQLKAHILTLQMSFNRNGRLREFLL
jgi:hypothetical protein